MNLSSFLKNMMIIHHVSFLISIIQPRSGGSGIILHGSTPEKFATFAKDMAQYVESHPQTEKTIIH